MISFSDTCLIILVTLLPCGFINKAFTVERKVLYSSKPPGANFSTLSIKVLKLKFIPYNHLFIMLSSVHHNDFVFKYNNFVSSTIFMLN